MAKELIVSATGRRKESIARVRMKPGSMMTARIPNSRISWSRDSV